MWLKKYFDYTRYAEILHLTKFELVFCLIYFVLALFIDIYSTPSGSLFSPDSTAYVGVAKSIHHNFLHNLAHSSLAPIYPVLIAVGMNLGLTSEQAATMVPIISYSLLGFPVFLLGKIISRPIAGYLTCIICLFCGKYLLWISANALTDMTYLFFSAFAMLFLVIYNKYGGLSSITFAGIFTLLTVLTRYIGITLIFTGIIIIITYNKELKKSLISIMDFCLISTIPVFIKISISQKYSITTSSSNPSLNDMIAKFLITFEQIFYNDYKLTILILILFLVVAIIYLYSNHRLVAFIKCTIPLTSYILVYSITLILVTSSLWISVDRGQLDIRKMIQIYPYLVLIIVCIFIYAYDTIQNEFYKHVFSAISIILLICLVAQGANSLCLEANAIRTTSIKDYSDRDRLSAYISEHNLTNKDKIYRDGNVNWPIFHMEVVIKHPDIPLGYIGNTNPGATILDNFTYTSSKSATTLADLVNENKNSSVYIIVPYKISQKYLTDSSKAICLSKPSKFSNAIIYKVDLIHNDSCKKSAYNVINSSSIDILQIGDYMGIKRDQLLLLGLSSSNKYHINILDFSEDFPLKIKYDDRSIRTLLHAHLLNADNFLVTSDFMGFGYSQLLYVDRDPKVDRIIIEDFNKGKSPAIVRYSEALGNNSTIRDLIDSADVVLAEDFLGLGHSQVLFIDRKHRELGMVVADFSKGKPSITIEFPRAQEDELLIGQWLDDRDLIFAGDFMGLGHSQLLIINCNHAKAESVKMIIIDFGNGKSYVSVKYLENWGESTLFDGWLDANDTQMVGDFMSLGYSQLLLVNHLPTGGKIAIADFSQGKPPAAFKYSENWNNGIIFQGWLDINDTKIAGDFKGFGYSQVLFFNNSINGVKAIIVDFTNGMPIPL